MKPGTFCSWFWSSYWEPRWRRLRLPFTPREFGPKEENLAQIIPAWGFSVDNNALRHAIPLESLPPGDYSINHYALDPGKSRPGVRPLVITLPGRGHQPPADGIRVLIPKNQGVGQAT